MSDEPAVATLARRHARALLEEARAENERRAIVLAGDRERGYETLEATLEELPVGIRHTTLVGPSNRLRCEHYPESRSRELLGQTRTVIVVDAHEGLDPNTLGRAVGAVDGGGLLILLTPSLDDWPTQRDAFDHSLAVPPFDLEAVTGHFRRRLVETVRAHRGIAAVDVDAGRLEIEGTTDPAPKLGRSNRGSADATRGVDPPAPSATAPSSGVSFPAEAHEACRTADQQRALETLESLRGDGTAVVLESDRGRGKSSAIGLAAASLAAIGDRVLVTAPEIDNAGEVFARARELLADLEGATKHATVEQGGAGPQANCSPHLETEAGGSVTYVAPSEAAEAIVGATSSGRRDGATTAIDGDDVLFVDEAAALPVSMLEAFLGADRVAFATTIHGYEGAGRGFSVRFRDRLEASTHEVVEYTLTDPIRYAAGDPLEAWSFRTLLLDASPPVEPLVESAAPESVTYRRLDPRELLENEWLLRETFGLLVLAHYRTEPNDLARLLDAPNLTVRALTQEGHVVSVALLAREGSLDAEDRATMYEGGRIRGNMIPDVLTSHLRDEGSGRYAGIRVVRIATHHAARDRGLATALLERIETEFRNEVDWLGTGFGATPGLVSFWSGAGYRTVHLSTTRNDRSGEYSAIMLRPTTGAGRNLLDRHEATFARRLPSLLTDSLRDLDADVVRNVTRSIDPGLAPPLELSPRAWAVVAGAAYGPGLYDVDPDPFRNLAMRYLLERQPALAAPTADTSTEAAVAAHTGSSTLSHRLLDERAERLLVQRVLQCRPWGRVATALEYPSSRTCKRALGDLFASLTDHYGGQEAASMKRRFEE